MPRWGMQELHQQLPRSSRAGCAPSALRAPHGHAAGAQTHGPSPPHGTAGERMACTPQAGAAEPTTLLSPPRTLLQKPRDLPAPGAAAEENNQLRDWSHEEKRGRVSPYSQEPVKLFVTTLGCMIMVLKMHIWERHQEILLSEKVLTCFQTL